MAARLEPNDTMSSIPPPPPLPPSRQSKTSAFTRLITQPFASRPQANRGEIGKVAFVFPQKLPGPSPLSSQTNSFKVGADSQITSLDISKDKNHVILAGRDTLQTIKVEGKTLKEGTNIISAIIDKDRQKAIRHRDTLDIRDVKWSHGSWSNCIATAASNAHVVIYDLYKPGVEIARLHQHTRQVHKVAFSPFQGYWLLSASQDGTVRIWDLRSATPEITRFQNTEVYLGESDGIRDVKWSPSDAMDFAFCTDRGSVQVWDMRNAGAAKLKFANAHDRSVAAVDWHPDGRHLLSAGQDQTVKIWDTAGERRQKPQWQLRTPYPVHNARWRVPVCMYDDAGNGSWQCTQIATSYDKQHAVVHVWDFRRPHMPFREASNWKTAPTDMIWPSQRLLWSTHREGQFHQTDIRFTPKVIDRRPMQAMAISPTGEICVFAQRRPRKRISDVDFSSSSSHSYAIESMSSENITDVPELSISRSVADDSIDDHFLTYKHKRGSTGKQMIVKPNKTGNSANGSPSENYVDLNLPQALYNSIVDTPVKQTAYHGYLGGTLDTGVFSYLAQKYKTIPSNFNLTDENSLQTILRVFEDNSKYARRSARHREAQLWRILAKFIELEWARKSLASTLPQISAPKAEQAWKESKVFDNANIETGPPTVIATPEKAPPHKNLQFENLSSPMAGEESESKLATPIAKARDPVSISSNIPDVIDDAISLPPSLISSQPEMYLSKSDIESRKAQMSNWRAQPKQPLEYHLPSYTETSDLTRPPQPERHNSNESFAMLSTSADSPHGSAMATSFGNRSHRPSMSSIPESVDPFLQDPMSLSDKPLFGSSSVDKPSQLKSQLSWVTSSSSADMALRSAGLDSNGRRLTGDTQDSNAHKTQKITGQKGAQNAMSISHVSKSARLEQTREPTEVELILQELEPLLQEHFNYYTDNVPSSQTAYHLTQNLKPIFGTINSEAFPSIGDITPVTLPGIGFLKEEAILSTYHDLLQSLQIYNPAIELSKSSFQFHSDLFEQANVQAGLVCLQCSKPITNPDNPQRCEHCSGRQSPCPICWQKYPAIEPIRAARSKKQRQAAWERNDFEDSLDLVAPRAISTTIGTDNDDLYASPDDPLGLTHQTQHPMLWQSCFVCGHGAHAVCMQTIQADGRLGGKCPTEGCLCDCIPGTYRDLLDKKAAENRALLTLAREAQIAAVRRDTQRVAESKAVRTVRAMLDSEPSGSSGRRVRVVEPMRGGRS